MLDVVAVIDDDPLFRQALKRLISSLGYAVELYASGEAFLARAAECPAICLMIDVQLGSRSGIELARQLADAGWDFPIVFMTGNTDERLQWEAIELNCVGYLRKPFVTELLEYILTRSKVGKRD